MRENIRKVVFFTIFVIFAIALFLLVIYISNMPCFKVREAEIVRGISSLDTLYMKSDPTNRNVAWHQETLPSFIQKDMNYAKEKGYSIKYICEDDIRMELYYNDEYEEWWLNVINPRESYITGEFTIADFSIYKNNEGIVIYGYDATYRKYFGKVTIGKDYVDFTALTYDTNLPFELKDKSIRSNPIGEYSLVIEEQNVFSFYKDGNFVFSQEFSEGKIGELDQYNGFFITEDKDLYMMYVMLEDNIPTIKFVYIDQADRLVRTYSRLSCLDENVNINNLPIIIKDCKYYVVIPEEWDTMALLGLANTELNVEIGNKNLKVKLVEIEKAFKTAKFTYTDNKLWYATLKFEFNSVEFSMDYQFGGYDDSVELPETVVSKYTNVEVYSIDELWEYIESLRIEYFDYYDHKGG